MSHVKVVVPTPVVEMSSRLYQTCLVLAKVK